MAAFVSGSLVTVCVHTVSDSKAAPASETQRARASVSDASLIRVEAFISASPQWTATLSVRSALAALTLHGTQHLNSHVWLSHLQTCLHYCKYFMGKDKILVFKLKFPLFMNFVIRCHTTDFLDPWTF